MVPVLAVDRLRQALEQVPGVRLAVLFGSAATGTAGPKSDVDVGILLAADTHLTPEMHVGLERAARRPIDLVRLDTAPPLLRFEIARTGRVLVEREEHGWADFRAHAMIDWWDWAPTARMMHATMAARLREETRRGSP
jgi:predicted nucleotidyltransferase